MSNCPNCNTLIREGESFCSSCGTKAIENGSVSPKKEGVKIHCPNCKSNNITISTESSVNGAVTASHGRFSSTAVSNTHRNFWFCSDCGTKFRNIQSLEEEIKKNKKQPMIYTIITVIASVLAVYWITSASNSMLGFFMYPSIIPAVVFAIVGFCYIFISKNKLKKMKEELKYLRINCFD